MKKDYFLTKERFLILDIQYPYQEMLEEAKRLSHRFIPYRNDESNGWESLTLYGLSEDKTSNYFDYGYQYEDDAMKEYCWTVAAHECPVTMNFLKNVYPSKQLSRTRFMKLKAGGWVAPHSDTTIALIDNVNLVLNNPDKCVWQWGDGGEMLMVPGVAYGMNTHYVHGLRNDSNEDRYHMIVQRLDSTNEWKEIINTAVAKVHGSGDYHTHDTLS